MKTKTFITAAFLIFGLTTSAQKLPLKVKPGKCYVTPTPINFDYNKKLKTNNGWIEKNCDSIKKTERRDVEILKNPNNEYKKRLISYQKFLKSLGYNTSEDGKINEVFIKAHNDYIKQQSKANKKRRKIIDSL